LEPRLSQATTKLPPPSVAADSAGNFVVVWNSYGSGGTDTHFGSIQAQRYESAGLPVSGEFQVNTYTYQGQRNGAVAVDGAGNFVVVWESFGLNGGDSSSFSIWGQRFDSTGALVGGEFRINTYTTGPQDRPAVAVDSAGNFLVVWESNGSSGTDTSQDSIQGQLYDSTGAPVGGEFQVNTYTSSAQRRATVATDGGGNFVVAWDSRGSSGTDNDGSYAIVARVFDSAGAPVSGEFQVNTLTTMFQRRAAVAVDSDGDFIVAWDSTVSGGTDADSNSVQAQLYDGPLSEPLQLTVTGVFNDEDMDGFGDPGETIDYTYEVTNPDLTFVPLTNVSVTDPDVAPILCPNGNPIPTLGGGVTESCTGTYVVTQADVDAGRKDTTTTADSAETGAVNAAESVPLAQNPAIGLVKTGLLDLGGDGVATVGDLINYLFDVTNTGNVTLTDVTVSDPMVSPVTCPGGAPGTPDLIPNLAPGATASCTGSYAITQADLDAGVKDNTAAVDADDPGGNPVSDQDSHSETIPRAAFACTGEAYIVQNVNAELSQIDQSSSPFTFIPIGGSTGREINNLGFRVTDGLLYGVELNASGNDQLVQIDATGSVFGLGRPAGLPASFRFDGGDVSTDGTTMYVIANNSAVYRVALPSLTVTSVAKSGAAGNVFDWAYNPADGRLYGGDSTSGQLAVLDPVTGVRTDFNVTGLPSGDAYGGAWFNVAGQLFLYRNNGEIYEIDLAGPTVVDVRTGPGATRNDGAACVQSVIGAAKQMTATSDGLPETVTIDYAFENFDAGETLFNLTSPDDLSAVFGVHGVDWTFTSISATPASFANPAFDGHTDTELIDQAPAQSLAPGASATVTVTLELLTFDQAGGLDVADLDFELVVSGLASPVAITHAGDPRLFVTEQAGRVAIVAGGTVQATPFLDISARVGTASGEQGLFSVAFHPDYANNGLFYVDYTDNSGDTVISRFSVTADPNVANPASEAILLTIPQPFANHNGGQLQFGADGFLYVASGDGGSANDPGCEGQDGATLLGAMLRLDVDQNVGTPPYHGIPASNPFVGDATVIDEIWALGMRNPWRFSFDRDTGDMYIGDVGQGAREEVDLQPAASAGGENYGWKVMEGTLCTGNSSGCAGISLPACNAPELTLPILEYDHSGGRCSITGGYVYRGSAIPAADGLYVYGDFCTGEVFAASDPGGGWQSQVLPNSTFPFVTTFGEDVDGELYLARNGNLYRLTGPAGPEFCNQVLVTGEAAGGSAFGDLSTDGLDPDPDGDASPDERQLSCVVIPPPAAPAPAIQLVKTGALDDGGDGFADPGDVIDYTFQITNTGNVVLTDVTVTDPMVSPISCPSGQPIPALGPGASETCTGSYTVLQADVDAGVKDNTASVSGDDPGANPVNDQDSHSEPLPSPGGGGPMPFACTGDAYIVQNQNAQLTRVDQSVSPFVFVPIGAATGIEINNLGFRATDGLLYAVELSPGGNVQVIQIDANGDVFGLGRPTGLPAGPRFDAG
ncbi:MAG: PQQ-dependent sugar dehydrogenase, partial [Thermoanaerobaculia bacterium]